VGSGDEWRRPQCWSPIGFRLELRSESIRNKRRRKPAEKDLKRGAPKSRQPIAAAAVFT